MPVWVQDHFNRQYFCESYFLVYLLNVYFQLDNVKVMGLKSRYGVPHDFTIYPNKQPTVKHVLTSKLIDFYHLLLKGQYNALGIDQN